MAKVISIDEILDAQAVTLVIGGKEFTVKDMPLEARNKNESNDDENALRKLTAKRVGCTEEDLKDYGLVGLTLITNVLFENLLKSQTSPEVK